MLLNKWFLKKAITNKASVKKVLIVSLSNIGDVILTLPCVDIIKSQFPDAEISLVVGPKAAPLFEGNPHFKNVFIFDKHQSLSEALRFVALLRRERFDLAANLRNSWLPILAGVRAVPVFVDFKEQKLHMKDHHLTKLSFITVEQNIQRCGIVVHDKAKQKIEGLLGGVKKIMVVAPGAAAPGKRWDSKQFANLAQQLYDAYGVSIVIVGDQSDNSIAKEIMSQMRDQPINLCGKTTLIELAEVLSRASLVIANDSAPMHMASYLNAPVAALFGRESNSIKYGPWSNQSICFSVMENILAKQVFDYTRQDQYWQKLSA